MNLVLPPKRFEQLIDPKFDPIRHHRWFGKLAKRREKIPRLAHALKCLNSKDQPYGPNLTQKKICEVMSLDERELRDYEAFADGIGREVPKPFQHILDAAYFGYCDSNGKRSLTSLIKGIAPLYGQNPRHVTECWEVDPTFQPTNYVYHQ